MSAVDERPNPTAPEGERAARLARTCSEESGLWGWLTNVDPKVIGKRYVATGIAFFISLFSNFLVRVFMSSTMLAKCYSTSVRYLYCHLGHDSAT